MLLDGWLIGVALLALTPMSSNGAADSVTLADGKIVLGELIDSDRRGPQLILLRRAWAEANLPAKLAAWEKAEALTVRKAETQRRDRLIAWKRDRRPDPAAGDRITPWIDRELDRLVANPGAKSPLMLVKLGRGEIKAVNSRSKKDRRMLRLGWLSNLPDVETMSPADLAQAVEGRGFSPDGDSPVSVDPLLPITIETDAQWLIRRAATEVVNDPGGRLLRYQGMILPEPAAGEAPPAAASLNSALGSIKELLGGEAPVDPLPGKLREFAGQGRVGVVMTRLEMAPDFSQTSVETTLWVRGGDRWIPAVVRSSSVRTDDLPANAGAGLAEDPQVKAAFGLVESLGLGEVPPELKRRSLNMGAATSQALGQARAALHLDLNQLSLSLEAPRANP